jgi:hypothetical protein
MSSLCPPLSRSESECTPLLLVLRTIFVLPMRRVNDTVQVKPSAFTLNEMTYKKIDVGFF